MSLLDQIKEDEEELAKLEEAENEENEEDDTDTADSEDDADDTDADEDDEDNDADEDDTDEDDTDDDADTDDDTDDTDDKGDDPKSKGLKDKPKSKAKTNDDNAKLRVERKRRLKLEKDLAEAREAADNHDKPVDDKEEKGEPETAEERLDRIENAQQQAELRKQAVDEFVAIEDEFKQETPDYEDASKHMISGMYNGVKAAYPHLTDKQAGEFVHNRVLEIASSAARRKQNPAEVLYQMAFDNYGFDPLNAAKKSATKKKTAAQNLKTKAKNKKRSANGLSGGGQNAGARVTIEEADKMNLADFGNMSDSEIDALIDQAGS